jgi:hypothetical protein
VTARWRATLALAMACAPVSLGASGAHMLVKAVVTFSPQTPHVREPWHVEVAIQSADAQLHPERRVRLIGTMSGHAMRPVESVLTRAENGSFGGALAFTMRGPWIVTVRVDDLNDMLTGDMPVEVVKDDESTGVEQLRTVVELHPPVRANLLQPAWVTGGAVALTFLIQLAATLYRRRRNATPQPSPLPSSGAAPTTPSRA